MPRKREQQGQTTPSDWKTTTETCSMLNCSAKHLANLRKQGVFKLGIHWRVMNPKAARLTYRYHLKRCEAVLEKLEDVNSA